MSASIAIEVTPGRDGFGPALALEYRSGGSNGILGRGWSLSGPLGFSVHTAYGLPRYDGSDLFSFSGAGELVPYATASGDSWEDRGAYRVLRYRPRFEAGYLRIERWVEKATGAIHWRTRDARNALTIFGRAADGRIADPEDASRVFSWQPDVQIDALGNAVRYDYAAEDFRGVDGGRPEEAARRRGGIALAQRYLKRIRWGNVKPVTPDDLDPAGQRWCFELVFDFGDHDPAKPRPAPDRPWSARPDAHSNRVPGFELRVYRLCRRILLFHHFPELDAAPLLVHAYAYDHDLRPEGATLTGVRRTGYRKEGASTVSKQRPPLTFGYTAPRIGTSFSPAPVETLEAIPQGLDGPNYRLLDLYGEGLPGLLIDDGRGWIYKANEGGGRFGPARTVLDRPGHSIAAVGVHDFDSDGNTDLTVMSGRGAGYYAFDRASESWGGFTPFPAMPHVEAAGGYSQWLDLSGDGLADLVLGGPDALTWYRSKGRQGFADGVAVQPARAAAEPAGFDFLAPWRDAPGLNFFFADMTGDGLLDQVLVQNGSVVYWPSLGLGRFGPAVVMDGAPRFAADDAFDASRLLFADLDGTGTTDLLYLGPGEITAWTNAGGNTLLAGKTLRGLPSIDIRSTVRILDFLGDGTLCLVWSARHGSGVAALQYLPLTDGVKPGLLTSVDNAMGLERRVTYGTSAAHYLRDKRSGRPWSRKLPRHTVVVDAIEVLDRIGGGRSESRYRYHDGSYDGRERSLRGFGFVEVFDAERHDDGGLLVATTAPSCVRTWHHLGAEGVSSRDLMWTGDAAAPSLAPTLFESGGALDAAEAEDALLAVSGIALRQETFRVAPDGSLGPAPFRVEQTGCLIRRLQPAVRGHRASFAVFERERMSAIHEEKADDPRILHELTLSIDAYGGRVLKATVAYPRRAAFPALHPAQAALELTVNRMTLAHVDTPERMDLAIGLEAEEFDVADLLAPATGVFTWADVKALAATALASPATHEADPVSAGVGLRLGWARSFYWDASGANALPLGQTSAPLRLHHAETAAFTPAFAGAAFDGKITAARLAASFYRQDAGHWWQVGESFVHGDAATFRRLVEIRRPDGGKTAFVYDAALMKAVETTDAVGNRTRTVLDYHLLAPMRSIDANENVSEIRYDPLGVAVAWSMRGEVLDQGGNTKVHGFEPLAGFALPANATPETAIADPAAHVGDIAQALVYDVDRWATKGEPPLVVDLTREKLRHDGMGGVDGPGAVGVCVTHFDGFGRVLQEKIRVDAGEAVKRGPGGLLETGPDGRPVMAASAERWRVAGHTVHNRKQQPIRRYEPFFSTLWRFEPETELAEFGVFHAYLYDPLGRPVRHDEPNGTFSRVEHGTWAGSTFDPNDTVEQSTYRISRSALAATHPERLAYDNAKRHAGTPQVTHVDPMGRTVLSTDTSGDGDERRIVTHYGPDGEVRRMIDPRGLESLAETHDMLGRLIRSTSPEAGTDIAFHDGLNRPVEAWNARGVHLLRRFDTVDRIVSTHADGVPGLDRTTETIVYGEDAGIVDAVKRNLRGAAAVHRDEAGTRTVVRCDIVGHVLESVQRIVADPKVAPDWSSPGTVALLPDAFRTQARYDGFGRVTRQDLADGSTHELAYLPGGGLATVTVTTDDGLVAGLEMLGGVAFNARGQRASCRLGNGVEITQRFDPDTWRTVNIKAARGGVTPATLQDLDYAYDPVGNIVHSVDRVHQPAAASAYVKGLSVAAERTYRYDGFYQLREATGRVHKALLPSDHRTDAPNPGSFKGSQRLSFNDGGLLERYTETYTYDLNGNMKRLRHQGASANWTNDFWISPTSNRSLPSLDAGGLPVATPEAQFDPAGNMLRFPYLHALAWNHRNAVESVVIVDRSGAGLADDAEFYVYDASNRRIRKLTERLVGGGIVEITDVLYLDGCEIRRIARGGTPVLERRTTHVTDGFNRVAEIHRWALDTTGRETSDTTVARLRYQLSDHLGSAMLHLDETGGVVSYEEYLPFGGTGFIAGSDAREAAMRTYRFCGKERDDATGLYYFGHRYYAPWMCRWISADPIGQEDGLNVYLYVHNNPITYFDPSGLQTAQKRGKEVPVSGAVPLKVHEAFAALPAERQAELKKLMAEKNFSWFVNGATGSVHFGTRGEIQGLVESTLGAGENVGALSAPPQNAKPGTGKGKAGEGKGKKKPAKAPKPPADDGGDASGKGGNEGAGTGSAKGKAKANDNDPAAGQDGTKGGAKNAGGDAGDATGTGNSNDPGGSSANPGDGGVPGGTGGPGTGTGTQGTGKGGGGTSDDPAAVGGAGAAGKGTGEGTGTGTGSGDGDADKGTDKGEGTGAKGEGEAGGAEGGKPGGTGTEPGGKGTGPGGKSGGKPGGKVGGKPGGTGDGIDPNSVPGGDAKGLPDGTATGVAGGEPGNTPTPTGDPNGKRKDQGTGGAATGSGTDGIPGGTGTGAGKTPGGTGQAGGEKGGEKGKGSAKPQEQTVMDRVSKIAGYWNLEFGDGEAGGAASGGVPGAFGTHNWGGWGQALYVALTVADIALTILTLGGTAAIKAGFKALMAAGKKAATAVAKKAAILFAKKEGAQLLTRASIATVFQGLAKGALSLKDKFLFWAKLHSYGGVTKVVSEKKILGFWPSITTKITNNGLPWTLARFDTTVHELFHKFVFKFIGPWSKLGDWKIAGRPVGAIFMWAEETVAYALGRTASLRFHGIPFAPYNALQSVFLNNGGGAAGRQAVIWAVGEIAAVGIGVGAYFGLRDKQTQPTAAPQGAPP